LLVELTINPTGPRQASNSPVDGIRILALLPQTWHKELARTSGEIVIRVDTADDTTPDQVHDTVAAALTDPALRHWRLDACRPVTGGDAPPAAP
jgi:hypothetical protein